MVELTSGDVAVALGKSKPTIRRWASKGFIPHFRDFGGHRKFDPRIIAHLKKRWAEGAQDIEQLQKELYDLRDKLALEDEQKEKSA